VWNRAAKVQVRKRCPFHYSKREKKGNISCQYGRKERKIRGKETRKTYPERKKSNEQSDSILRRKGKKKKGPLKTKLISGAGREEHKNLKK